MLNLSDVTFCIKSFRRFSALLELVQSVSGRYPHSEILVADDSFDATPVFLPEVVQKIQRFPNLKWLQMPFDSGLSRGRNLMVDECKTEFLVMLDDDFLFTGDTDISKWPDILSGCDLVSGYVEGYKNRWTNPQSFFVDGKTLCCKYTEASCSLFQTELFLNFFMVRTATIRNLRWDDQFKITSEHIDSCCDSKSQD